MTSPRKIEANRRNAKRSTGPRTVHGKQRSRTNALKHGLAAVTLRPADKPADNELYESLLGPGQATPVQQEQARAIVEATRELEYVRSIRASVIKVLDDVDFSWSTLVDVVVSTERYERRASARRRKAAKRLAIEMTMSANSAERSQK